MSEQFTDSLKHSAGGQGQEEVEWLRLMGQGISWGQWEDVVGGRYDGVRVLSLSKDSP